MCNCTWLYCGKLYTAMFQGVYVSCEESSNEAVGTPYTGVYWKPGTPYHLVGAVIARTSSYTFMHFISVETN